MNKRLIQKLENKRKNIIEIKIGTKDRQILQELRKMGIIYGISNNSIRRNKKIIIKKIDNKGYYLKKERNMQWILRNKYNDIYIIKTNKNKYSNNLTGGKMKLRIKL